MVDSLVPREYLLPTAMKKVYAGKPHRPRNLLTNNRVTAAALAAYLRPKLNKKTRGHYPAVQKALEVVTRGISSSVEASLRSEVESIMSLTQGQTTRNLIQLFFQQERAKKLSVGEASGLSFEKTSIPPIQHCAVVGAGVMGSGIAQWLSAKGMSVILRDIKPEFIAKGMSNISRLYTEGVKRHAFTPTEARAGFDRVSPASTEVPLQHTDLVIEAAVEDMALKKEIFRKLEALSSDQTPWQRTPFRPFRFRTRRRCRSSRTHRRKRTPPPFPAARSCRHVAHLNAWYFFNPVHRMQLVEVVRAPATNPATVQRAIQFVQKIGKRSCS